jgi:hypothetical protein
MSSFREEALIDIARVKLADQVDEYKVAALHLMVDRAFANPYTHYLRAKLLNPDEHIPYNHEWDEIEYYGCRPKVDYKLTRDALHDFMKYGIDYEKSTDPAEETGRGFAGTFVDSETFTYLKSIIFTGNNILYVFSMVWDNGFAKLIQELGAYKDYPLHDLCDYRVNNMLDVYRCPVNWDWIDNQ